MSSTYQAANSSQITIERLRARRQQILQVARRHGVARIQVFGSLARGDATPASDVDLLIEVEGPTSPWFPGGLVFDLETLLGCRVDIVEPDALRAELRETVLQEAVAL
jgi:hypothetical protein